MPLSLDMGRSSRTLLVTFGGMQGQIDMPPFEFFRATGSIPVKRLFVRDLHQAWYHRGIPGHGSTIPEMAESLGRLIAKHEVDRLVTAGNSSGGYGALVFGALLGADTALCFAPQTVLDPGVLAGMRDRRWEKRLTALAKDGGLDPRWTDLRRALPPARRTSTRYEVFFDEEYHLDRLHAEHIGDLEGVSLCPYQEGKHSIVKLMRDSGDLDRVLRDALRAPQAKLD